MLNEIEVPDHYNYVGVFLTLSCNLKCSYCINHISGFHNKRTHLSTQDWIQSLNRLRLRSDLPLTLQGGEPSVHPGFFEIIKGLKPELKIDILTNLQFSPHDLIRNVSPDRLDRASPYPSIRVSYHPETMQLSDTLEKATILIKEGYSLGVYSVDHPDYKEEIQKAQDMSLELGIPFKRKELLGEFNGKVYGSYLYEGAVASKTLKNCECKTSELLISPEGNVFRCHHDLYNSKGPVGSMTDTHYQIEDIFRPCAYFGNCNPCDIKVKNNRFENFGHTSVEIKNIRDQKRSSSESISSARARGL